METNNIFSLKRFMMLFKHSLIVNKKLFAISVAGVAGSLFAALFFLQSVTDFYKWGQEESFLTFLVFFLIAGVTYACQSFPGFRSKEKSVDYLMLPASTFEKFSFEIITRVFAFIIFAPVLFWLVANIEGAIVHFYKPALANYKFSFGEAWGEFTNNSPFGVRKLFMVAQAGMLVFMAAFTGAVHFSKSPFIKTIFISSVIVGGFALYIYVLFTSLNMTDYSPSDRRVLFINFDSDKNVISFFAIAFTLINLSLLAISWFRLKEKEA